MCVILCLLCISVYMFAYCVYIYIYIYIYILYWYLHTDIYIFKCTCMYIYIYVIIYIYMWLYIYIYQYIYIYHLHREWFIVFWAIAIPWTQTVAALDFGEEMSCNLCGRCLQKRIFCFKNGWVNQVFSVKYPPLLGNGSYLSTLFHARNAGSKQQNMGLLNDVMQTSVIFSWSLLSLYFSLMSDCCWRYVLVSHVTCTIDRQDNLHCIDIYIYIPSSNST